MRSGGMRCDTVTGMKPGAEKVEVMSDILRSMQVRGSVYFCDQLTSPWRLRFDDEKRVSFHVVRRGEAFLKSGDKVIQLGPGDMVLLEPGMKHALSSQPPGVSAGEGATTLLMCGYCEFDGAISTPLKNSMPSVVVVRNEEIHRHTWLKTTLDQMSCELINTEPGAELVIDKLTEILIIELFRINFGREEQNAFLSALKDKRLSKALQALHSSPETHWTIQSLADHVGISRAALAKRFRDLVGQPMYEYLTAIRVEKAKNLLRGSGLSVAEVAYRIGYESDIAFSRTFKKQTGLTPAKFRKAAS